MKIKLTWDEQVVHKINIIKKKFKHGYNKAKNKLCILNATSTLLAKQLYKK